MVNQHKIITMTRLALYDKHEGYADRVANDYFRHDYIYRNNLGTRLAVGFGSIIILGVYWLQDIFLNQTDLFELDIQQNVTDSILFILAVLAVYSLIGTIQGTRQYYLVQKRLAQYQALVRQLERLEERARRVYDDEPELEHEEDIAATRQITSPLVRTSAPIEHTRLVRRQPSQPQPTPLEHTRPIRPQPAPAVNTGARPQPAPTPPHAGTRPQPTPTPSHTGIRPQPVPPVRTGTRQPSVQPPLPPGSDRPPGQSHVPPTRPVPEPATPIEHTRVVPRPTNVEPE